MKNFVVLLVAIAIPLSAFAGEHGGVPMAFIKLQLWNFLFFAALLIYLSRSKIAPIFKQVKDDYIAKSQEAQRKLEEAKSEKERLEVSIAKLEAEFKSTVAKAEKQAEVRYQAKLADVKVSIESLNKDLDGQIEGLKRSQATALRNLLMEKSIEELKADLGSDVDKDLLVRLQNSFVENVERA